MNFNALKQYKMQDWAQEHDQFMDFYQNMNMHEEIPMKIISKCKKKHMHAWISFTLLNSNSINHEFTYFIIIQALDGSKTKLKGWALT